MRVRTCRKDQRRAEFDKPAYERATNRQTTDITGEWIEVASVKAGTQGTASIAHQMDGVNGASIRR
jgi:hypothetical protein